MLNEDRRTIEEAYTSAAHSSDLSCETRDGAPRSDSDLLIAAGWSKARLGGALLRLHTEYDGAERPRLARAESFHRPGANREARHAAAQVAHAHNLHETGLLLGKLKTLPDVRAQLAVELSTWRCEDPAGVAVAVVRWWLHQCCPACEGRKFERVGADRLSGKACKTCGGTGLSRVPHGETGKRLASFIEECVCSARGAIGGRLRNTRKPS